MGRKLVQSRYQIIDEGAEEAWKGVKAGWKRMDPTYVQGLREAKALLDDGVFSQEEFDRAKANLDKESQERKKADGVGVPRCLAAEHRDILGDSQAMVHEREHSREQASVSSSGGAAMTTQQQQPCRELSSIMSEEDVIRAALEAIRAPDAGAPSMLAERVARLGHGRGVARGGQPLLCAGCVVQAAGHVRRGSHAL